MELLGFSIANWVARNRRKWSWKWFLMLMAMPSGEICNRHSVRDFSRMRLFPCPSGANRRKCRQPTSTWTRVEVDEQRLE